MMSGWGHQARHGERNRSCCSCSASPANKNIANILSVLTTVAGLTFAVLTGNHAWLITGLLGLGLSFLQIRHQHREATTVGQPKA
jgi:hypothetical protein